MARQTRGFSQQQLAGMAGVSRQAVSAVESGHSDPSLRVALALAQALGMSVEELFGPGEPTAPVTAVSVAPLAGAAPASGPAAERAGGERVMLAPVGDRFVALPLRGDTGVGLGFLPAGGLAARAGPHLGGSGRGRRVRGDRRPPDRPAPADARRGRLRPGPPAARHPAVAARPAGRLRLVAVRLGRGAPPGPSRPGARGRRSHPDRQRRQRRRPARRRRVVGLHRLAGGARGPAGPARRRHRPRRDRRAPAPDRQPRAGRGGPPPARPRARRASTSIRPT